MKHCDYMCVRGPERRECERRYGRFGWKYVCDASERGGGVSFRRDACIPRRRELDELQSRCDDKAAEIDRILAAVRAAGYAASAAVAAAAFVFTGMGMSVFMRAETSYAVAGGCVCLAGAAAAAAAFPAGRIVRRAALAATRRKRSLLGRELSALLAEAESIGDPDRVL